MNGQPRPKDGRLVSLTRVLAALRKLRVAASAQIRPYNPIPTPRDGFSASLNRFFGRSNGYLWRSSDYMW